MIAAPRARRPMRPRGEDRRVRGRGGALHDLAASGGSTPRAMAGGPSVMRLTHSTWIAVNGTGSAERGWRRGSWRWRRCSSKLEADELDDVGVDGAALLDRADDGGEVVVGQHHVGGFLGDLGAGDAHGHADVGGAQRGGVVDAVAGHGHDVAVGLAAPRRRAPCARATPGRTRRSPSIGAASSSSVMRVEVGAGDDSPSMPSSRGDGAGGGGVVAGDHLHLDAGLAAEGDGVAGLGAGRVDDADQRVEGEARRPSARGRRRVPSAPSDLGRPGAGARPRASTRRPCDGQALVLGQPVGERRSSIAAAAPSPSATAVHRPSRTSGAPLTQQHAPSSPSRWNVAMNLVAESNGTSPRRGRRGPQRLDVDAALGGQRPRARPRWVADERAVAHRGVVAQRAASSAAATSAWSPGRRDPPPVA